MDSLYSDIVRPEPGDPLAEELLPEGLLGNVALSEVVLCAPLKGAARSLPFFVSL